MKGSTPAPPAEHEKATSMIREASAFRAAGIARSAARSHSRRWHVRTGLEGWYLKRSQPRRRRGGRYYVWGSTAACARLGPRRARPAPLVVGRGARDGDTFRLELLQCD